MSTTPSHRINSKDWFFESDFTPSVDAFVDYLEQGRYAKTTIQKYIGGIAHFARWTSQSHLSIDQLDDATVSKFLDDHLPHCDCPHQLVEVTRIYELRVAISCVYYATMALS